MQAHRLSMRAGFTWLGAAFALYRKNPPLMLSASMAYLLFGLILAALGPFLALLLPILQPTLMVLLANVYSVVSLGKQPQQADLVFSVVEQRPALVRLGLLQFAAFLVMALLSVLVEWLLDIPTDLSKLTARDALLYLLPLFIIMIPVFMAFCFAPVLTAWHNMPPAKAMFFSFVATWRNIGAFVAHFIYCLVVIVAAGLVLVVLSSLFPAASNIIENLLRLIMLLVFIPTTMAAIYIAYREIFELIPEEKTEEEGA